eukprot:TRINITY_DN5749_c0_g2_i1.p1 TRINITY_DN5749_c0_g2~~TRINITY_DN5749_c0_g2_i1.p1  ORF type:complete len:249 (-),score=80.23 TRINITY_DN5749_c0_g2_i1:63-809(-)
MYIKSSQSELDLCVLRQFIKENSLGLLTTSIRSPNHKTIQSSHIPFILDVQDDESPTELGKLRGHIARANPQAKAILESLADSDGNLLQDEVLILFNSPVHHYIPPKFYIDTKPTTGKVVPTWNYRAVQVYGRARIFHDKDSVGFLSKQISDLSHHAETSIMGHGGEEHPEWKVTDAPERYISILQKAIFGIEIEITSMEGRFKMGQEDPKKDREGIVQGFKDMDSPIGNQMAQVTLKTMERYDSKRQ